METIGNPSDRVIPFDYVTSLELTGRSGNLVEDEIPVNVEGGFVTTNIGYGLAVEERNVEILFDRAPALNLSPSANVDLATIPLRIFPSSALLDGVRIKPSFVRVALENNGRLASSLPGSLLERMFERLNRPEDVSFRYAVFDSGGGRELQNQRVNNIAGLGIANGDRPFKKFARPMVFLPRSTIRVEVEERFGRGTLFMSFQGYKILNVGGRR